jgi:hypothetical protein
MHRMLPLTLAICAALGGCTGQTDGPPQPIPSQTDAPAATHVKPDQPLDLEFWFDTRPAPGATVRLGLAVTPRTDLPACELSVQLPAKFPVVEGKRTWRGRIERGRRHAHFLSIRVPDDARHRLFASAHAVVEGARFARTVELVIDGRAPAKPAPTGELKTNTRGETIFDFPAERKR